MARGWAARLVQSLTENFRKVFFLNLHDHSEQTIYLEHINTLKKIISVLRDNRQNYCFDRYFNLPQTH